MTTARRTQRGIDVAQPHLAQDRDEGGEERQQRVDDPRRHGATLDDREGEQGLGRMQPVMSLVPDRAPRPVENVAGDLLARMGTIVHDCVASFPSVTLAGCPWIRVVSANPLEITDPDLPPVFSGYSSRDRSGWDEFWVEYRRLTDPLVERSSAFHQQCGAPPLPDGEFQYQSPYLNLYMYPAELDYDRSRPLGSTWHRIDTSTRNTDGRFDVADKVSTEGKLVYLSLGSLGCMDVPLMQRVIDSLDQTPHRVIVSTGSAA